MGQILDQLGRVIVSRVAGLFYPPPKPRRVYRKPKARARSKVNYYAYLKSDKWKEKRKQVLEIARGKCEKCGKLASEVHHETYKRLGHEWLIDLTALCRGCHSKIHGKDGR